MIQGGVLLAVDSRATGGQFIGSQTMKKIVEINDYLLGKIIAHNNILYTHIRKIGAWSWTCRDSPTLSIPFKRQQHIITE